MENLKLLELPDEVLYKVCERMDLTSLGNFVKTNRRVQQLCQDLYDFRYKIQYEIDFSLAQATADLHSGDLIVFDGKVYVRGRKAHYLLDSHKYFARGFFAPIPNLDQWMEISYPEEIVKVSSDNNATFALSKSGRIYVMGKWSPDYTWMIRGISQPKQITIPQLLPFTFSEPIVDIATRSSYTLFVGTSGTVYGLGCAYKILGLPSMKTPTALPLPEPMIQVQANYNHQYFLGQSGTIYVWGSILLNPDPLGIKTPELEIFSLPEPASRMEILDNHQVVLTQSGNVYLLDPSGRPPFLFAESIVDFSVTVDMIALVRTDGTATITNLDVDEDNTKTLELPFKVLRIAIGSFFAQTQAYLVSDEGKLYNLDNDDVLSPLFE